jgi:hypothetical protein
VCTLLFSKLDRLLARLFGGYSFPLPSVAHILFCHTSRVCEPPICIYLIRLPLSLHFYKLWFYLSLIVTPILCGPSPCLMHVSYMV